MPEKLRLKNTPPRAIISTRVSSDKQEEGTSLGAQLVAWQQAAQKRGAVVVRYFEEIVSGALYKARPNIQEALQLIESGEADLLILPKLDRAGRDVVALRDIRLRVQRAGGELVFADGLNFEKSAVGNLMFTQLSGFAEFERELIRERTAAGRQARAEQGRMPNQTMRPFGYHLINKTNVAAGTHTKDQIGTYEIKEDEAKIVRILFERYAGGDSLYSLTKWLNETRVPQLRNGNGWQQQTVRKILMNPVYYGRPAYRKTGTATDESRIERGLSHHHQFPRDKAEWIHMDAPALVSKALWDRCQERLATARASYSGRPDRRHILSGLLRCPQCGCAMRYKQRQQRAYAPRPGSKAYERQVKAGKGIHPVGFRSNPHRAYKCPQGIQRRASHIAMCNTLFYNADRFEAFAIQGYLAIVNDNQLLIDAREAYLNSATDDHSGEIESLTKELKKLEAKEIQAVEREIEARAEGVPSTAYAAMVSKIAKEREGVEERLKELQKDAERSTAVLDSVPVASLLSEKAEKSLLNPDVPSYEKNAILMRAIKKIEPDDDRLGAKLYLYGTGDGPDFVCHVRENEIKVSIAPS